MSFIIFLLVIFVWRVKTRRRKSQYLKQLIHKFSVTFLDMFPSLQRASSEVIHSFLAMSKNSYLRLLVDWLMMSAVNRRANWILMEQSRRLHWKLADGVLKIVFIALINSMWTQSTVSTIETFRRFISRQNFFPSFPFPTAPHVGRKSQAKKCFVLFLFVLSK